MESPKSEKQSVAEVFCDKDSETRRFQFDQGTYPRLSQSTAPLLVNNIIQLNNHIVDLIILHCGGPPLTYVLILI